MGVFKSVVLYRTDGNQVMAVADMSTSHLLNAINHHNKQVETIHWLLDTMNYNTKQQKCLTDRAEELVQTVEVLGLELAERDPKDDEERFPKEHPSMGEDERGFY
jgi:predicted transposase YbfD/YdcC